MMRPWQQVADEFHERVRAACWDDTVGTLVQLHRPHIDGAGEPVCTGCDRQRSDVGDHDPTWPCRTYTVIAQKVLDRSDVEECLNDLRGDGRYPRARIPPPEGGRERGS